ncbi:MAG TPA: c-type cytochrome [Longimicrobiales bacterium]
MKKRDKPRDQVLGHAEEADGIEEYDNALPDWWLGLLWFTVIWAIGYTLHYHFIADRSQEKHLAAELAAAETRWPQSQSAAAFIVTEELAQAGEAIYQANCVACHGAELQGGIGPNLVDDVWIHGSSPDSVLKTIRDGVAAKGMPTWGPILGPDKTRQVAAFVLHEAEEETED